MVIWFPLGNTRSKYECVHTMRVGMVLVVRPYVHHIYIYGDKHSNMHEAIQILPRNLSEGGSFRLPIIIISRIIHTFYSITVVIALHEASLVSELY